MVRFTVYYKVHRDTGSFRNTILCIGHLCGVRPWALMLFFICAWIKDWVNNREAGDLRHPCTHYVVTVMSSYHPHWTAVYFWSSAGCDRCRVWQHSFTLIAQFMGPTWGPSGTDRTQVGPMLAPENFAIWAILEVMFSSASYFTATCF